MYGSAVRAAEEGGVADLRVLAVVAAAVVDAVIGRDPQGECVYPPVALMSELVALVTVAAVESVLLGSVHERQQTLRQPLPGCPPAVPRSTRNPGTRG